LPRLNFSLTIFAATDDQVDPFFVVLLQHLCGDATVADIHRTCIAAKAPSLPYALPPADHIRLDKSVAAGNPRPRHAFSPRPFTFHRTELREVRKRIQLRVEWRRLATTRGDSSMPTAT
jgi:hypothetical protein